MTDIFCSAEHCAHNKDCSCCLENVRVGGDYAENPDGTRCSDFLCETADMAFPESPCHCANINCDAENCRYNRDGECDADTIDICGENSCTCGDTCCSTFRN